VCWRPVKGSTLPGADALAGFASQPLPAESLPAVEGREASEAGCLGFSRSSLHFVTDLTETDKPRGPGWSSWCMGRWLEGQVRWRCPRVPDPPPNTMRRLS